LSATINYLNSHLKVNAVPTIHVAINDSYASEKGTLPAVLAAYIAYHTYYCNLKATARSMQHPVDKNDCWNPFLFLVAPSVW
jgi:hypothetical protein